MASRRPKDTDRLARLKPYHKGKRHLCRRYHYRGVLYEAVRGWYRVDGAIAEELKELTQDPNDLDSPPLFDVCTEAEARAIEEREAKKAERRGVRDANEVSDRRVTTITRAGKQSSADLSTDDLRSGSDSDPGEEEDLSEFEQPEAEEPPPAPKAKGSRTRTRASGTAVLDPDPKGRSISKPSKPSGRVQNIGRVSPPEQPEDDGEE